MNGEIGIKSRIGCGSFWSRSGSHGNVPSKLLLGRTFSSAEGGTHL